MSTISEPLPTKISKFEKPVPFTEDFRFDNLTFDAQSYQSWVNSVFPEILEMEPEVDYEVGEKKLRIMRFPIYCYRRPYFFMPPVPCRNALEVYSGSREKKVCFTDDVLFPVLRTAEDKAIMSLTPNEVYTQRSHLKRMRGNVAISGLGLGWVVRKALERDKVRKVTVFEIDKSVIDRFGPRLLQDFGDRLEIKHQSAYDMDWEPFDCNYWDIWNGYDDAETDRRFLSIRKDIINAGKLCLAWCYKKNL